MSGNKDLNDLLDLLTEDQLKRYVKKQLQSNTSVAREDSEVNKAKTSKNEQDDLEAVPDDLITKKAAAETFGYSGVPAVQYWVTQGYIKEYPVEGITLVSRREIQHYLDSRPPLNKPKKKAPMKKRESLRNTHPSKEQSTVEIEDWTSTKDAAKRLGMSQDRVEALVAQRNLAVKDFGQMRVVHVKEIYSSLNNQLAFMPDPSVFEEWLTTTNVAERLAAQVGKPGDYEAIRKLMRRLRAMQSKIVGGFASIASHKIGSYRLSNWGEVESKVADITYGI